MSYATSTFDLAKGGYTRRRLLMLGGTAVATVTCAGGLDRLVAAAQAAKPALNPLSRSRFIPHLGQRFRLSGPGGIAINTRLDAIRDLSWKRGRSSAGSDDGFVLLFHGPRAPRLEQGVLRVRHPKLGTLDLLVSPAGTGRGGQDYAAVVNRIPHNH